MSIPGRLKIAAASWIFIVASLLLLDYGADANAIDCYGSTPLAHACRKGHSEVTRLLLERGQANPNRRSHQGFTPLLRACAESGPDREVCVRLLLERRADVTASKTPDGTEAPLVVACRRGDARMSELLIDAYAAQGADRRQLLLRFEPGAG